MDHLILATIRELEALKEGEQAQAALNSAATISQTVDSLVNDFEDEIVPGRFLISNAERVEPSFSDDDSDEQMVDADIAGREMTRKELIRRSREHVAVVGCTPILIHHYLGSDYSKDIVSARNPLHSLTFRSRLMNATAGLAYSLAYRALPRTADRAAPLSRGWH